MYFSITYLYMVSTFQAVTMANVPDVKLNAPKY